MSYCDRYLSRQNQSVRKSELQLIGVSALFFAAKLEEIYPPKLGEFAYVTDSACTEVEMREMELIMLKVNYHTKAKSSKIFTKLHFNRINYSGKFFLAEIV